MLADHDRVRLVEDRDPRREPGRGGERAEHGHRDVAQRDLRRHHVAEPRERHAEPVAPAHALARVGDEAVGEHASAGSRRRCSSRPRASARDRTASCRLRRRRRGFRGARARARRSGRDSGRLWPQTVFEHTERSGLTPANQPASVSDHNMPFGRDEHSTRNAKLSLVREWLEQSGASAVVLTQAGSVAWLTGGLTNPVERGHPASPLWIVVRRRRRDGPDERGRGAAPRGRRRRRHAARRRAVVRARCARGRGGTCGRRPALGDRERRRGGLRHRRVGRPRGAPPAASSRTSVGACASSHTTRRWRSRSR